MDELLIREMQESDIPEVLTIERISFTSPWTEEAFQNELLKTNAFTRVAVSAGRVIGYISVYYVFNECHILNLAIHPANRRQGIATALMQETICTMSKIGCRFFYLEVRMSNTGAQAFYERFGFRIAGIRKKYYLSPVEDAAIMMLKI